MNLNFLITRSIYEDGNISQRELAKKFCISLGKVNQVMKECENLEFLTNKKITNKGIEELKKHKVDRALILACDKGVHLVAAKSDAPKCFIEIDGKRMIERQIEQLKSVGINDITIMVGYLKEKFDYLIDKYGIKLIYNEEYDEKNTLATLYHARDIIKNKNIYICVSDVYMEKNIYHAYECEPHYTGAYFEDCKDEWRFITTVKNEIKSVAIGGKNDYCFVGHCFMTKEFTNEFLPLLEKYYNLSYAQNYCWEDVLIENLKILPKMYAYKLEDGIVNEFDSISDINAFDKKKNDDITKIIMETSKILNVKTDVIKNVKCIKETTSSKTYTIDVEKELYIIRVPEKETFVKWENECEIYKQLKGKDITEDIIYISDKNGYKIAKCFDSARNIDIESDKDLKNTMKAYKKLHSLGVKVNASCDIIDKIHEYMDIVKKKNIDIPYEDFDIVYKKEKDLETKIKALKREKTLCHGDPNPKNIFETKSGFVLVNFEYAGMADPLTDIALFGINVGFDIKKTISLLYMYDETLGKSDEEILVTYMALGGFYSMLWSLLRETTSGFDYGSYGMRMYRVFKDCEKYQRR